MALVLLPYMYVPDPIRGRPVFSGKIYIGEADTDPRIPANQKIATLVQENGSRIEAEYPILTNAGGVPTYNGSPVAIDVVGTYSLAIDDRNDQQVYYYPIAGDDVEFLATDLRSIMFDLGLTYDDIGTVLVLGVEGTELNEARYILDVVTGEVWILGPDIPLGTTVVSLSGSTLVTNNGQFELKRAPNSANQIAPNLIKTSRLVVEGTTGDQLPTNGVDTSYTLNSEVALDCIAGTAITDLTNDEVGDTGNWIAASGEIYYEVEMGPSRTLSDYYGSIMQKTGGEIVQIYSTDSSGITLSEPVAGTIRLTVDFSVINEGFIAWGISEQIGRLEILPLDDVTFEASPRDSENLKPVTVKAWVIFNGIGVPSIIGSYNVASITNNGTGNYTINTENALEPTASVSFQTDTSIQKRIGSNILNITTFDIASNPVDCNLVCAQYFSS